MRFESFDHVFHWFFLVFTSFSFFSLHLHASFTFFFTPTSPSPSTPICHLPWDEASCSCSHSILRNIYPCNQVSTLRKHKQSKHEDIKFPCDKCDYVAPRKNTLKQHKESMHEGVRYPCDLCDYVATWKSCLNDHKKAKHQAELLILKKSKYRSGSDCITSKTVCGSDHRRYWRFDKDA